MGVGSRVSDFVCAGITRSYSKLWSALPRRYSSPPRSSTAADNDVSPAGCRRSSHVIRDSHPRSFVEAALSKRQALLCDCRNPNRRGLHVQPGLAGACTSLELHRFFLGLQHYLNDRAGRRETRALWSSGPESLLEEVAFPATSCSYDTCR